MAFCENCGMQIPDDAKFCENCGAPQMQAVSHQSASQNTGSDHTQAGTTQAYEYGTPQQDTASSYGGSTAQDSTNTYSSSNTYNGGSTYNSGNTNDANPTGAYSGEAVPAMGIMEAVQTCFSKYVTFSGRARRSEYWYWTLFVFIVQMVLGFVGNMIFGAPKDGGTNVLQSLFSLAILLPSVAVFWRRMHDIGRTGLWFLLNLVPCVGQIVLLVFECTDSEPGENQYGVSPKYPV